jgi:hypothetical protein
VGGLFEMHGKLSIPPVVAIDTILSYLNLSYPTANVSLF